MFFVRECPTVLYRWPFVSPLSRATGGYIQFSVQALSLSLTRYNLTFLGIDTIATVERTFTITVEALNNRNAPESVMVNTVEGALKFKFVLANTILNNKPKS